MSVSVTRTQLQQAIPLGIVAREPGSFQAEDDADLAHGDFMGHLRKTVARDDARAGVGQVFVDDFDLRFGPAQLGRPLAQLVLPFGRLAIDQHLRGGGLANVNVSASGADACLGF